METYFFVLSLFTIWVLEIQKKSIIFNQKRTMKNWSWSTFDDVQEMNVEDPETFVATSYVGEVT